MKWTISAQQCTRKAEVRLTSVKHPTENPITIINLRLQQNPPTHLEGRKQRHTVRKLPLLHEILLDVSSVRTFAVHCRDALGVAKNRRSLLRAINAEGWVGREAGCHG